jgi:hypothetical protein
MEPCQRRNVTAETVTTTAAPIVSASEVSRSTSGSSGETDISSHLQGLLQGQDPNGVVGVDRRSGTRNRTRRRRARFTDNSTSTATGSAVIGGKQHRVRAPARPAVGQRAELGTGDRVVG